jgi:hypothetical protein
MTRLVLFAAALLSGCSAPLPNSSESPEALARAVLAAIEHRDRDALLRLALNRQEFTDYVWPELPAARPERNLSAGYVWGDLNQKSNLTLQKTLAAHGGRKYELVSVKYLGKTTPYDSYLVHRETELTIRDAEGERQLRLFGSVIEKGGRFKVFSYVVDD